MENQSFPRVPIPLLNHAIQVFRVTGGPEDPGLVGTYTDPIRGDILHVRRTELLLVKEARSIRYRDIIKVETAGTNYRDERHDRRLRLTLQNGERVDVSGIEGQLPQRPEPDVGWVSFLIQSLVQESKERDPTYKVAWSMGVRSAERSPKFDFDPDPQKTKMFPEVVRGGRDFGVRIGEPLIHLSATQTDTKRLCDAFKIIGFYCFSDKLRQIIEEFEPGVHQFFRIDIKTKNGDHYDVPYYIFHACTIIDAFVLTKGRWHWHFREYNGEPHFGGGSWSWPVSAREIGTHHVWTGGFMGGGVTNNMYISDALKRRLVKEKVRYLDFTELEALDVDWRPEEELPPSLIPWLQADPSRVQDLMRARPRWVQRYFPELMP